MNRKILAAILAVLLLVSVSLTGLATGYELDDGLSEQTISHTVENLNVVETSAEAAVDADGQPLPADVPALELESKSAVLIEASTGKILFEQNKDEQLPPASVTKVMTMLLIMEEIEAGRLNLEDLVTCSEYAAGMGGTQVYLEPGEQMTVDEMLKAIAVASGNDACVAMAEHIAGTAELFVQRMNERAKELGMNNTNFVNCNGLDADGHVTTSYDIALMSRELLKHDLIRNYTTIWMDTIRGGKFQLANTNKLIKSYAGATGLKTGSTGNALYCLSASAKRDNMELIAVIMGAPSTKVRFAEATKLLDYGFGAYTKLEIENTEPLEPIAILKGKNPTAQLTTDLSKMELLIPKNAAREIQVETEIAESLQAPASAGQKVGTVKFLLNGEIVGTGDIVLAEDAPRETLFGYFGKLLNSFFMAG